MLAWKFIDKHAAEYIRYMCYRIFFACARFTLGLETILKVSSLHGPKINISYISTQKDALKHAR